MDLQQQVKNSMTTSAHFVHTGATSRARIAEVRQFSTHRQALQAMSNGEPVAYSQTLRVVTHEGNREPSSEATVTRKHPGFIRNEFGGFFTS